MTKKQINKLGERLRDKLLEKQSPNNEDLKLLQQYRIDFRETLLTVSQELHRIMNKIDKTGIITYRVKRIESIFSKLLRERGMALARMQDIAGARCILENEKLVRNYLKELQQSQVLKIISIHDYILKPKTTGYKSIHVICECQNKMIEIQIRDENQHAWATLVEITDVIFHTEIKEKDIDNNTGLSEFFRIFSKGRNLSYKERKHLNEILIKNQYIQHLTSVFMKNVPRLKKEWCKIEEQTGNFYLFRVDDKNKVEIKIFDDFTIAEDAYFSSFKVVSSDNIVMAYIINNDFKTICKAYSNYILIKHNFYTTLANILQNDSGDLRVNSDSLSLFLLCKTCQIYINTKELWIILSNKKNNNKFHEWENDRRIELKQIRRSEKCNYKAKPSSKEYEKYYRKTLVNLLYMEVYLFFKKLFLPLKYLITAGISFIKKQQIK